MSDHSSRQLRVVINACSMTGAVTGIGSYARNLIDALSQTSTLHQYIALLSNTRGAHWPDGGCVQQQIVDVSGPLWEQLQLPPLLRQLGACVYHNPAFGLPIVKASPYVCTVHDCIPRLFPEYAPAWLRDFFERWAPMWLNTADHLLCASARTRDDILHLYGVDPSRASVVYQTVNEGYHQVTEPARIETAKARHGIDLPYVLYVGRVELRKNVPGLVEAFRILQERMSRPMMLVIAGPRDADVYDPRGLLPPQGRRGNVLVTGYLPIEDLAALYSGCAAFCFPSFYEGFGIPILEAMSCGAPVVTSRVSSMPEVGGDACEYVNPYDPRDIAEALQRVLEDDVVRERMRAAGLARASQFSPQAFAAQTVAVYERVAREHAHQQSP